MDKRSTRRRIFGALGAITAGTIVGPVFAELEAAASGSGGDDTATRTDSHTGDGDNCKKGERRAGCPCKATWECQDGLTCQDDRCTGDYPPTCGGQGEPCCDDGEACDYGLECLYQYGPDATCQVPGCGNEGEACCSGEVCDPGLFCNDADVCQEIPSDTGCEVTGCPGGQLCLSDGTCFEVPVPPANRCRKNRNPRRCCYDAVMTGCRKARTDNDRELNAGDLKGCRRVGRRKCRRNFAK